MTFQDNEREQKSFKVIKLQTKGCVIVPKSFQSSYDKLVSLNFEGTGVHYFLSTYISQKNNKDLQQKPTLLGLAAECDFWVVSVPLCLIVFMLWK